MRRHARRGAPLALSLLVMTVPAWADAIDDWSRIALHAAVAESPDLGHAAYTVRTAHAAMFEALLHLCRPETKVHAPRYTTRPASTWGPVSRQGVAALAAHQVLRRAFPRQADTLNHNLARSLAALTVRPPMAATVMARSIADIVWSVRGRGPTPARRAEPGAGVGRGIAAARAASGLSAFRDEHAQMLALTDNAALPLIDRVGRLAAWAPAFETFHAAGAGRAAQNVAARQSP